jgi:hypothetical protein
MSQLEVSSNVADLFATSLLYTREGGKSLQDPIEEHTSYDDGSTMGDSVRGTGLCDRSGRAPWTGVNAHTLITSRVNNNICMAFFSFSMDRTTEVGSDTLQK